MRFWGFIAGCTVPKVDSTTESLTGYVCALLRPAGRGREITAREMCAEMVAEDLKTAQRHALLKEHGFELPMPLENG